MLTYFNIYLPVLADLPASLAVTVVINFAVYLLNKYFRKTGLNPKSNYFFNVDTEGIRAFELCYKLLPHEFLYTIPVMAVYAVLAFAITMIVNM